MLDNLSQIIRNATLFLLHICVDGFSFAQGHPTKNEQSTIAQSIQWIHSLLSKYSVVWDLMPTKKRHTILMYVIRFSLSLVL